MRSPEPGWKFADELYLWERTGGQDAANVMDANEIEEELGPEPTVAEIKKWLLSNAEKRDFSFEYEPTENEKDQLLAAWAQGWASFAQHRMHSRIQPQHRGSR